MTRARSPEDDATLGRRGSWLLGGPMLVFVVAMFGYPAYLVLRTSVASGDGLESGGFSLTHYVTFFSDSLYLDALLNTFVIAVVSTAITAVLGLLYAYEITRRPGLRTVLLLLLVLPLLVNGVVRIYGLQLGMISLDRVLLDLGLRDTPLGLQYSFAGIIIALVMFQFPFMALAVYAGLSRLDVSLVEAAQTLGAPRRAVLLRVVLPLAVPGLVAGSVLTFAAAAGTFIVPAMMGGGRVNTIPQMIYTSVSQTSQWATASAFAVVLVAILAVSILYSLRRGLRSTAGTR